MLLLHNVFFLSLSLNKSNLKQLIQTTKRPQKSILRKNIKKKIQSIANVHLLQIPINNRRFQSTVGTVYKKSIIRLIRMQQTPKMEHNQIASPENVSTVFYSTRRNPYNNKKTITNYVIIIV